MIFMPVCGILVEVMIMVIWAIKVNITFIKRLQHIEKYGPLGIPGIHGIHGFHGIYLNLSYSKFHVWKCQIWYERLSVTTYLWPFALMVIFLETQPVVSLSHLRIWSIQRSAFLVCRKKMTRKILKKNRRCFLYSFE